MANLETKKSSSVAIDVLNMEQNSTDMIVATETLINAVQNEPSLWNTKLNSSEEDKELAWTRIARRQPVASLATACVMPERLMHWISGA